MIKQSQIGNFVSLIKALKSQKFNYANNQHINPYTNSLYFRRKNKLKTDDSKRSSFNKENTCQVQYNFQFIADNHLENTKILRNSEILKKKKAFQNYCEEKKKKLAKFQTISLYKSSDLACDGTSLIKYSKISHQRANTSQKVLKCQPNKIQQPQETNIKQFRNTTRTRQNYFEKMRKMHQNSKITKYKERLSIKSQAKFILKQKNNQTQTQKQIKSNLNLNTTFTASSQIYKIKRQSWALDPWQNTFQIVQQGLSVANS